MNNLWSYGLPFIYTPKTEEEKIEEAKASGLLNENDTFIGASGQTFCCKNCGSLNVVVYHPIWRDDEKGCEIPYHCRDCGYKGTRVAKIKNIQDGKNGAALVIDLIPDGLVGIPQFRN